MENSSLQRIKALFSELEELALDTALDLGTLQELHCSADALAHFTAARRKTLLKEYKDRIPFFKDADTSCGFAFGKCGDEVFWKIVEGVLYISGKGPMWDFGADSGANAPWHGMEFSAIVIHGEVSSIGAFAFENAEISDVMIPACVKTVGTCAFWNAKIQTLLLPRTLERLEEGIVCGDGCNVDTLTVSASIPNFSPYSLFNRNSSVAKTVVLTDELPKDLSALAESGLFLNIEECKICYPAHWDGEISLFQRLANCFPDPKEVNLPKLKAALIPQNI